MAHIGIIIEGVLIFGGMLAFGAWQLWTVRHAGKRREEQPPPSADDEPPWWMRNR